jgi:hypothetical protein
MDLLDEYPRLLQIERKVLDVEFAISNRKFFRSPNLLAIENCHESYESR